MAGATGVAGPTGPAGAQGQTGQMGAQGSSTSGAAGVAGPAGPAGAQGPTGPMGATGPTLVGPSGPAGPAGSAGAQGAIGSSGAVGSTMAGTSGPAGVAGPAGVRGPTGAMGATGPIGAVQNWTSYRDFRFDGNQSDIRSSEMGQVSEIATYMSENPSIVAGIDGYSDPRATDAYSLSRRRVDNVRDALIQAGVPAGRIQSGAFGDPRLKSDGRVEVLVRSGH